MKALSYLFTLIKDHGERVATDKMILEMCHGNPSHYLGFAFNLYMIKVCSSIETGWEAGEMQEIVENYPALDEMKE